METPKVALITGITGQDGSYLTELLLEKGYIVHGIVRRASDANTARIYHLISDESIINKSLFLHYGDLTDTPSLIRLISTIRPIEIYNLAGQSDVAVSFDTAEYTADVNGVGCVRLLDAIKTVGLDKTSRFYQASTSEMFGKVRETPQSENTPFYPRSPYGAAKLYAYWAVVNYREAYGIHASNGILFNHESPRRGPNFVTRKISKAVARIKLGYQSCLNLGNLESKRDWGHSKEYVNAMWLMLQQPNAEDYVISTGETHSVREFVELAFAHLGITIRWEGSKESEVGINTENNQIIVRVDPKFYRPTEVDLLLGNSTKAKANFGWEPKITFKTLVNEMVDADFNLERRLHSLNQL
eukprot:TRINITY_DN8911_c0_g1_i1.p1 TRINITY_DN8911_c0_g1~~TRINITY_DN8911_c0_g1_i1.p1  ORF type:complete len:356 (+),score=157.53 TRINITY_DN8911_c0_g1_i1:147-1214(+)